MVENATVNNLSLFYLAIAFIIQFIVPIALAIYLYRKKKITKKPFIVGLISFIITHIVVEIVLIHALQSTSWYQNFARSSVFLASFFFVSVVGFLEEIARVKGFILFLKKQWDWKDGIAFGLGFGGMESIFAGLSSTNKILATLAINYKAFSKFKVAVPVQKMLITTAPSIFLAAGLESLFVLSIQIGLTLLALYGIRNDKHRYSIYAVIIHILINLPLSSLNKLIGVWGTEALLALIALIAVVLSYKAKEWYSSSINVFR
ncbi:MAG: YhfC family glutamic-type intramembrane protease [Caldicoprobacterales bacterium]